MVYFHLSQAVHFSPSAGATGSGRLRTSTDALAPSALPATAEGVETTCASKVSEQNHIITPEVVTSTDQQSWTTSVCSSVDSQRSETEDMNEVEKPQVPLPPRTTPKPSPKPKPVTPRKPVAKPATPRAPSTKTPSSTYLGTSQDHKR